jgi:hypothetical protein
MRRKVVLSVRYAAVTLVITPRPKDMAGVAIIRKGIILD